MTDAEHLGRWFTSVTKPQLAVYNARMAVAGAYRGAPRWERERDAAQREFHDTTSEARQLYELAMSDLEALGEVSEQTDFAMTQFSVHRVMEAAE